MNLIADLDLEGDRMMAPNDLSVTDGDRNVWRSYVVALIFPSPMFQGRARNV